MERVYVFDTTLRDGEQSPGAAMTVEQKLEIALQLARIGVDVIEAGFPISSPQQFQACELISERVEGATVAALARIKEKDIIAAGESTRKAAKRRIHTFSSGSDIHLTTMMRMTREENITRSVEAIKLARTFTDDVEYSAQDTIRADRGYLVELYTAAAEAGAMTLNIPDTVGYSVPEEFSNLVAHLVERVKNPSIVFSVHCHNDLGLAVANSLSAIRVGARQVEVTVNGIGERAGNAALEELVMTMAVRKDLYPYTTGINTRQIYPTSRLLSTILGFPIARNKPVVGENAFAHESGIHQDGVLKNRENYEIMTPESVGREESKIVLGRHSGMHGFKKRLSDLGFSLTNEELQRLYDRFLVVADRKKEVYDEDLYAILSDELGHETDTFSLDYFNIISGNVSVPTATVRVRRDEELHEEAATGDGPIDAVFRALERATGMSGTLQEYNVQAITPGKQAMGEVTVVVTFDGRKIVGRGSSTDILEASARAYLNAMNRHRVLAKQ